MARSQRYGVDTVNLGVRVTKSCKDLLERTVPRGERGRFVDRAIRLALANVALNAAEDTRRVT